ncbi:coxsackievirus and adenovirus receptor-like [Perca flavescens]|uniref:coxsackievirus and adenovirus receptor-like n=1 Tax=Perca flavescens TaxID=8167 RepID=UPI00106E4123|nr:coxsackievirus and adenovirus receptor-like [Perca flavescens]
MTGYIRSALMAPLMLLLILLSAAASDLIEVTEHPGDDAILPCRAADSSILAVEGSRPDLEPDIVLLNIDGHLNTTHQHPSFKDRVDLVDRDLKDGDVSLILKNVNRHDAGTYECRVKPAESSRKKRGIIDSEPIRIIRLQVPEPAGQKSAFSMDKNSTNVPEAKNSSPVGRYVGLVAVLILVAAAVGVVLMYKRCKNKRPGQPAADNFKASPLLQSPP